MQSGLPEIGTLWIGSELPQIEWLCISSMVAHGHHVTLYAYDHLHAPQGVVVADASTIIPRNQVFTYKKTGSYATFADWFRLRMIAETGKIWLDADAALLQAFNPNEIYYFVGANHKSFGRSVNNYVLMAPKDSAFIKDALSYFEHPENFLRHMAWHRSARLFLKRMLTGKWNLGEFRWGVFGMGFLTELVHKHGIEQYIHIENPEVIEGVDRIFRSISPDEIAAVKIAHFFTSGLNRTKLATTEPEPGSIYEKLRLSYRMS